MSLTQKERIEGGLIGLLVGDALGVPYEFHGPEEIPPQHNIEFDPPPGFMRAHQGVPPGTWSDDGAQALCLLASLLDCNGLDVNDLGQRLLRWYDEGYCAVNNHVFDIGITTAQALRSIRAGMPAIKAGPAGQYDNGNGSLMRVLPLALWHQGSDAELVRDAQIQSKVTHGHLRSQVCCALYSLWARRILEGIDSPWESSVETLRALYVDDALATEELEFHIRADDPPHGSGSGYVVDCLRSARLSLDAGSYEQIVKVAIALGNDTDTTACVAGGIAGLRHGIDAIPERWRTALRGREIVEPLLQRLLERM